MSSEAMKSREKVLGQENEKTMESMAMMCNAYRLSGSWKEAAW
jgi:hypothetical protein